MTSGGKILGLAFAIALGGCGLVYRYGDYKDAPDAGGGGSGGATTVSATSAGGAGGCTPPADIAGDCQKPTCAGGVPGTEPDDTDIPTLPQECRVNACSGGSPTSEHAMDGIPCTGGVCNTGECVECTGPQHCGGRCCELGNTCSTQNPTCPDACLDGDETDVDCGGSCMFKCENLQRCNKGSDCKSGYCDDTDHCAPCQTLVECGGGCCTNGVCGPC